MTGKEVLELLVCLVIVFVVIGFFAVTTWISSMNANCVCNKQTGANTTACDAVLVELRVVDTGDS